MPGNSVHYDIRCATANLIIQAIGNGNPRLQGLIGDPDHIKVRAMPKATENIDPLPCIVVAPVAPVRWEPLSFENDIDRIYMVEFALVAAGNQDYQTHQEQYEGWLEEIARIVVGDAETLLCNANPSCTSVWLIEVESSRTFDRSWLNQNYAYQSILGIYHNQESRDSAHSFPFAG